MGNNGRPSPEEIQVMGNNGRPSSEEIQVWIRNNGRPSPEEIQVFNDNFELKEVPILYFLLHFNFVNPLKQKLMAVTHLLSVVLS